MSQKHWARRIVKRTISSIYVLKCFKYFKIIYILRQNISKKLGKKNVALCQIFMYNFLCQNVSLHPYCIY